MPGRGAADLVAGERKYSLDEALAIVTGYAFEPTELGWVQITGHVGRKPRQQERARWAYRSYDCIAPSPGADLAGIDFLIADGLNGQMRSRTVAALMAIGPAVSASLSAIDKDATFWGLDAGEVAVPGQEGSISWHLHRAWSLLMGCPYVNVAVCHKTLHHKRPRLFPLLDNLTITRFPRRRAWEAIHGELNEHAVAFEELEHRFKRLATTHHGAPLSRLRIHDILVWCNASSNADAALAAGRRLLARPTPRRASGEAF